MNGWQTQFDTTLMERLWLETEELEKIETSLSWSDYGKLRQVILTAMSFERYRIDTIDKLFELKDNTDISNEMLRSLENFEAVMKQSFIDDFFNYEGTAFLDSICPKRQILFEDRLDVITWDDLLSAPSPPESKTLDSYGWPRTDDSGWRKHPEPKKTIKKPQTWSRTKGWSKIIPEALQPRNRRPRQKYFDINTQRAPRTGRLDREPSWRSRPLDPIICHQCRGNHHQLACFKWKCSRCKKRAPGHYEGSCPRRQSLWG